MIKGRLAILVGILALAGAFQNCTPFNRTERKAVLEKGGDGYTGKTTYIHAQLGQPCPDGTFEKGVIEYSDSKAYLTKENCQPVAPPREVTEPGYMPYNPQALFVGPLLFEQAGTPVWSAVACRGQSAILDPAMRQTFADIQLYKTGQVSVSGPIYAGQVKIGYFDSQGTLASTQTVTIDRAVEDHNPTLGHRAFLLFHADLRVGEPSRLDLLDSGATLVFNTTQISGPPLLVVGMPCSSHD